MKFQIEAIFKITNRGYFVTVICLENDNTFEVTDKSKLGNIAIKPFLTQPRAIDENGNQRMDLFAFQLKNDIDFEKLRAGEIVNLINE